MFDYVRNKKISFEKSCFDEIFLRQSRIDNTKDNFKKVDSIKTREIYKSFTLFYSNAFFIHIKYFAHIFCYFRSGLDFVLHFWLIC
jgi:hypothetical protein